MNRTLSLEPIAGTTNHFQGWYLDAYVYVHTSADGVTVEVHSRGHLCARERFDMASYAMYELSKALGVRVECPLL